MTNETALIINAIILADGTFIVFIITSIIGHFKNSKEQKMAFFYKLFPRRLELYEDICLWVNSNSHKPFFDENDNLKEMLLSLLSLVVRSEMYGSKEITNILHKVKDFIADYKDLDMSDANIYNEF